VSNDATPPVPTDAAAFRLRALDGRRHVSRLARSVHSGRVAAQLREAILGGQLPAGTPLVEMRLAEQLGVSRGPIRSALQTLETEGLVRTLRNGRTESRGFDRDDLNDLFLVRFELESTAIQWGVARHSDLAPVSEAFESIEREGAATRHLVDLDVEYHRVVVEFSGSRFLVHGWLAVAPVIQAAIAIGNRELATRDPVSTYARIVESHGKLNEALAAYDAEAACRLLAKQFTLTQSMFWKAAPA